jgi:hypothetical protein
MEGNIDVVASSQAKICWPGWGLNLGIQDIYQVGYPTLGDQFGSLSIIDRMSKTHGTYANDCMSSSSLMTVGTLTPTFPHFIYNTVYMS